MTPPDRAPRADPPSLPSASQSRPRLTSQPSHRASQSLCDHPRLPPVRPGPFRQASANPAGPAPAVPTSHPTAVSSRPAATHLPAAPPIDAAILGSPIHCRPSQADSPSPHAPSLCDFASLLSPCRPSRLSGPARSHAGPPPSRRADPRHRYPSRLDLPRQTQPAPPWPPPAHPTTQSLPILGPARHRTPCRHRPALRQPTSHSTP